MENEKYIIASSNIDPGIGNRLKCLISVLRLSRKLKMKLLLLWMPPNLMGGADFSELFEPIMPQITEKEADKLKDSGKLKICKTYEDCLDGNYQYFLFNDWRFVLLPGEVPKGFAKVFPDNEGQVIDLEYEHIPLKIRKDFLIGIKKIMPIIPIRKKVDNFVKEHNNFNNVIGVQVRRRDFLLATDGRGKVSTNDNYFKRIREIIKENPKTKIFLATDCPVTRDMFVEEFKDKLIFFPCNNWDKRTKEATITGFIDMLLLSKTNHILGSFLSSFVEVAWWLGGCKAKVEIMGDEEAKRQVIGILKSPVKTTTNTNLLWPVKRFFKYITLHSSAFRFIWNKYLDYKTRKIYKKS